MGDGSSGCLLGIDAIVLCSCEFLLVYFFELFYFPIAIFKALAKHFTFHLDLFIVLFDLPLLALDYSDLVEIFLLNLSALLLRLLSSPHLCLLLALHCNYLTLKYFLFLLQHRLMRPSQ